MRQTAVAEKKINDESPEAIAAPITDRSERRRGRSRSNTDLSINMDELRELITLIRENALAEFELERQGFRVRVRREETAAAVADLPVARPVTSPLNEKSVSSSGRSAALSVPIHPGAEAETAASEDQDLHIITSPIVGTFYRSPSPTAEPFVRIGSSVESESVVCIIEAMKLMNEIQAETSGEVAKIYVENGQPVEYGQPLFGIKR